MSTPGFWDNQSEAQKVIDEVKHLKEQVETMAKLEESQEELELMLELIAEEQDESLSRTEGRDPVPEGKTE